jgi:hypothetical protein
MVLGMGRGRNSQDDGSEGWGIPRLVPFRHPDATFGPAHDLPRPISDAQALEPQLTTPIQSVTHSPRGLPGRHPWPDRPLPPPRSSGFASPGPRSPVPGPRSEPEPESRSGSELESESESDLASESETESGRE